MGLKILFMLSFNVWPKSVRMLRGSDGILLTVDIELCNRVTKCKLLVFVAVRNIANDVMKPLGRRIAM